MREFEKLFFNGAKSWLICRFALMGGSFGKKWKYDQVGWMIGELCEHAELNLICKEELERKHDQKQQ